MMISFSLQDAIKQRLSGHISFKIDKVDVQSIGGGSINETYQLAFAGKLLFCKVNSASNFPHLFQKEATGLRLLNKTGVIKVPQIIDCFEYDNHQVLMLEWISAGQTTESFWKKFGEQLACLHQISYEYFGGVEDNYMGSVPQINLPSKDWSYFFWEQRLNPLIKACIDSNLLSIRHLKTFDNLHHRLPSIYGSDTKPALVHGDLWSGNFMCNEDSEPVLIDPAVYYGHPSVDLGMTTLFGGFAPSFYEAYRFHSPFPSNYEEQWQVCNLYPLLIHLYLFGSSYLTQVERTLSRYQ